MQQNHARLIGETNKQTKKTFPKMTKRQKYQNAKWQKIEK